MYMNIRGMYINISEMSPFCFTIRTIDFDRVRETSRIKLTAQIDVIIYSLDVILVENDRVSRRDIRSGSCRCLHSSLAA